MGRDPTGSLEITEVLSNHGVLMSMSYVERVGKELREGVDKAMEVRGGIVLDE